MFVYYHEAECRAENWFDRGHSEGLYKQNRTVSTVSFKLLVCLQPNLV